MSEWMVDALNWFFLAAFLVFMVKALAWQGRRRFDQACYWLTWAVLVQLLREHL